MEEYKFIVKETNLNEKDTHFTYESNISVMKGYDNIMYLSLKFTGTGNSHKCFLYSLRVSSDDKFQDLNTYEKGVLVGSFEFGKPETMENAFSSLRLSMEDDTIPNAFGEKWNVFRKQYISWYKNILSVEVGKSFNLFKSRSFK